jgi:transcriptional regulator GlxA family with amidase domain
VNLISSKRHVMFLVYDAVNFLDVAGPLEAFWMASNSAFAAEKGGYRLSVASLHGGPIRASSGLVVNAEMADDLGPIDTLIVPGGGIPKSPTVPENLAQWIAANSSSVRRLCSVCTGAFILGAAGLLREKHVTTHWVATDLLRQKWPDAIVETNRIYVKDGQIWTSAGVTAGIDLALALIEEDQGFASAMAIARNLVVYFRREGSQSQHSNALAVQTASDNSFASLHAWIRENLSENLTVDRLAEIEAMSPRTFSRRYRANTGNTPAHMVELLRIEAARNAIVKGKTSLKKIARDCGFGEERNLRRALNKHVDELKDP